MNPGIKSCFYVALVYIVSSIVINVCISFVDSIAPVETAFFLTLFGPITFLLPYFEFGLQERFLVFALSYVVSSAIVVPLLVTRLYRSTRTATILFYVGVVAWFASGYLSFLANTTA